MRHTLPFLFAAIIIIICGKPYNANAQQLPRKDTSDFPEYRKSIDSATKVLVANPNDTGAFIIRAFAKFKMYDYTAAIADYTKCIELDPTNKVLYFYRALSLAKEGVNDTVGAIADYSKAIKIDLDFADAYIN